MGTRNMLARLVGSVLVGSVVVGGSLALAGAGPAAADTEFGHTGLVGTHSLTDTVAKPGTRCDYLTGDGREGAATVKVRPPMVFARDLTGGVDQQTVGWRVSIQHSEDLVSWYTVYNSNITKATATDAAKAPFLATTVAVPFNLFTRIRVVMFWYVPGSSSIIEGRAIHAVDLYGRYLDGTFEDQVTGYCPADLTP